MKIPFLIVGFGHVSQALVSVLSKKSKSIHDNFGIDLCLVGAVHRAGGEFHSAYSTEGLDLNKILQVKRETGQLSRYPCAGGNLSPIELIEQTKAKIMIEATPTNLRNGEPAITHIKAALNAGMHVVTANKGPVAYALRDLRNLANAKGVDLRYSACVAGALPVIPTGYYSLMGSQVSSIEGILNGTTNYILTEMEHRRVSLHEAVEEAQRLGIAETDPRIDIAGWDTAVKLLITANSIMNLDAKISDVSVSGIEKVTLEMIQAARENGRVLKLVGSVRRSDKDVDMKVALRELSSDHPFYSVAGTWKAVMFKTDLLGTVVLLGGKSNPELAAGAILRDVLNLMHDSLGLKSES